MKLDEIMTFGNLPEWVRSRLALVVKDFGGADFEFYLPKIVLNHRNYANNNGVAIFLTPEELIKVYFTLQSVRVEKTALSNLVKIDKQVGLPIEESFKDQDIQWQSVELTFSDGVKITIVPPGFDRADNLEAYKRLISKL